jgi:hypothetical protein
MERYVCVSHAAAIVAPLDTLIAGAQIAIPSKYAGYRCANIMPCRPPPEQPTKYFRSGARP